MSGVEVKPTATDLKVARVLGDVHCDHHAAGREAVLKRREVLKMKMLFDKPTGPVLTCPDLS